ncbi:hypothetical protein NQ318_010299 [Aromia moschata]|uniref:Cuticle protein n=1 Tax=Aromia moschata TaxID=1265417 RepID=A0AAV8XT54_9CUCU|nr:hypothetical protein NQ318_010299 [Aromia moschata]
MSLKIFAVVALVAVAHAGIIPTAPISYAAPAPYGYAAPVAKYAAPVAKAVVADEYDPHPQYNYAYDIQDGLTGDVKSQHEARDGDVVQGSYSLIDADGLRRTVDYTADPVNGFNAVVHREPLGQKVAYAAPVAKIAAPLGYAAPVAKIAAPLGYGAPVARYYH